MTIVKSERRLFVAALTLAFLLPTVFPAAGSNRVEAREEIDFQKVVELHKVVVLDGVVTDGKKKKKKKSKKNRRRKTLEITFSVHADVPKGAIILFELEYGGLPFGTPKKYKLEADNRSNLKALWSPKFRVPVDQYYMWTKMPLDLQSQKIQAAIKKKKKSFPMKWEPWGAYHLNLPIKIGNEADAKAEKEEIKAYFRDRCDTLIGLNGEFIDLCEEVEAGEKHVNGGTLNLEKFSEEVTDWIKKMAKVQNAIFHFVDKEPGLYKKAKTAHIELRTLSQMVAKRCFRGKLDETLKQYGFNRGDLKVPAIEGFNPNARGTVQVIAMKRKYDRVADLSGFAEDLAAEEAADEEE